MNHFLRFASCSSLLLVAATGCNVTVGSDGRADFEYDSLGPMSVPLAAGASDGISVTVPSGTTVDHASSSDPSVLTVGTMTSSSPTSYDVPVTAGTPGSVTFTIYDPTGKVIDQTTVDVAATRSIPLSSPGAVAVMENQTFALHATTVGAGGATLAGVGAIHFAYAGSLASSASAAAFCSGDCGYFQATSGGAGQVLVSAVSATATVAVTAVTPSAVDSLSVGSTTIQVAPGGSASTSYTLRSAGVVVRADGSELTCTSSNESVAYASPAPPQGTLSASPTTGSLVITGAGAGTATITCNVGNQQATVNVTVQ